MKTIYRILAPIISIAILPVLYFLPIIRAMVSSGLLGALSGNSTKQNLLTTLLGVHEFISINDIVKMASGDTSTFKNWAAVFDNLDDSIKDRITKEFACGKFLIASLVFLALLVLLVLALTVLSAVLKKQIVPLCLAGGAFISALAMNACFNAFAKPFVTGVINLGSILDSAGENAMLGALLGNAVSVDYLQLSVSYTVTLFILIVVMLLTVCALLEERFSK